MTDNFAALKALAEQLQRTPYRVVRDGPYLFAVVNSRDTVIAEFLKIQGGETNSAFFIAACNIVPDLFAEIERLEAELQAAR